MMFVSTSRRLVHLSIYAKVTLPDDIRQGIIVEMCPDHLKGHLQLNASKFDDYDDIRLEIMSFLEAKHAQTDTKSVPMDVGYYDKGKPKGFGKQWQTNHGNAGLGRSSPAARGT